MTHYYPPVLRHIHSIIFLVERVNHGHLSVHTVLCKMVAIPRTLHGLAVSMIINTMPLQPPSHHITYRVLLGIGVAWPDPTYSWVEATELTNRRASFLGDDSDA